MMSYFQYPIDRTLSRLLRHRTVWYAWLITTLLTFFIILPALQFNIEEYAYDAAIFHIYRGVIYSHVRAASGAFYPRWAYPFYAGAGAPVFSFYSPLIYMLMDALYMVGVAHPIGWRIWVGIAFLIANWGTFGFAKSLFRRADIALACATVYTYAHYFVQEFFERGSPQGFAIAVIPWIFWAVLLLGQRYTRRAFVMGAIAWAALFLFHAPTAFLIIPLLMLMALFALRRQGWPAVKRIALMLLMGTLLSAFYLLPSIFEAHNIRYGAGGGASDFAYALPAQNPLPWDEIVRGLHIYDTGLANNTLDQRIGAVQLLILLAGIPATWIWVRRKKFDLAFLTGGATVSGLAILWMMTPMANWLWERMPFLGLLLFRWRLFSVMGILTVVGAGGILWLWPATQRRWLSVGLIAVTIGLQIPSLYPESQHHFVTIGDRPDLAEAQTLMQQSGYWGLSSFDEFMPRWRTHRLTAAEIAQMAKMPLANLPDGGALLNQQQFGNNWEITLSTPVQFQARLFVHYFPGWQAQLDGVEQPIWPAPETGFITLAIPSGTHLLTLRYVKTAVQRAAEMVSLGALLALMAILFIPGKQTSVVSSADSYLRPRWWIPVMLCLALVLKTTLIDPHTAWFRRASTCGQIVGAQEQVVVKFGEDLLLCGYALSSSQPKAGDTLTVTLYWQATDRLQGVETFAHLLEDTPRLETASHIAAVDQPNPGGHNINDWVLQKMYADSNTLDIGSATPTGAYQLEVGAWRPATGERLLPTIQQPAARMSVSGYGSVVIKGIDVHE